MKKLAWSIAAVATIALALPGLVGLFAERTIYQQVEEIQNNPVFSLRISSFDRGWFSSKVVYEYGLTSDYLDVLQRTGVQETASAESSDPDPARDSERLRWRALAAPLELVSDVTHGPIGLHDGLFFGLLRADTTNGPANPRLNEFLQASRMPYLIAARSTTDFAGGTTLTADIPAANADTSSLSTDSGLRSVEFSGMALSGTYSSLSKRLTSDASAKSLGIVTDNLSFTIEGLSLSSDTVIESSAPPMGVAATTVESLSLFDATADTPEQMQVKELGLAIDTTPGETAGTANVQARYYFGKAEVGNTSITDAELTLIARSLSIAAMERYATWNEQTLMLDPENSQAMTAQFEGLSSIAHELASTAPSIGIKPFRFSANRESFTSDLNLSVDASRLPDIDEFDVTNASMWLGLLSGDAKASISEQLATSLAISSARAQLNEALDGQQDISASQVEAMAAAQAPILIETLVQQGLLQRSEGRLAARLTYDNGALLLNGQPLPMGALPGVM